MSWSVDFENVWSISPSPKSTASQRLQMKYHDWLLWRSWTTMRLKNLVKGGQHVTRNTTIRHEVPSLIVLSVMGKLERTYIWAQWVVRAWTLVRAWWNLITVSLTCTCIYYKTAFFSSNLTLLVFWYMALNPMSHLVTFEVFYSADGYSLSLWKICNCWHYL